MRPTIARLRRGRARFQVAGGREAHDGELEPTMEKAAGVAPRRQERRGSEFATVARRPSGEAAAAYAGEAADVRRAPDDPEVILARLDRVRVLRGRGGRGGGG